MKKNLDQIGILNALGDVHKEKINRRADMRREIEAAYEAKLYELKLQEASLMVKGMDAGLPKSVLGRAIGTTDWKTIQDMLDLGRQMVPVVDVPRDRFERTMLFWMNKTDVYMAITDQERPHEFTFADGNTYQGWKVALNTAGGEARVLAAGMELPVTDDLVVWVVENWKTLTKD